MNDAIAIGTARPRVGLVGNPSDLYGGVVIAFTFDHFATTVRVEPADAWTLPSDGADLLDATIRRFPQLQGLSPEPGRVVIETTVPRQSGLAGSSAIVIAALRALAARAGAPIEPFALARTALAVEVEDLGIVAGAQDRVAQAYERPVVVDVGDGLHPDRITTLDRSTLPPLVVAWSTEPGAPSGDVHAAVRQRYLAGDREVVDAAAAWRGLSEIATDALAQGDLRQLAASIDGTFDLRASLLDIGAADAAMVDLARAQGAAANQCGSGGSVVALAPSAGETEQLAAEFRAAGFGATTV